MATTTKVGKKIFKDVGGPSLKSFVRKSKAISLYRDLFRVAKKFQEDEQKKIEEEIRNGFNMNRDETDQIAIGYLLSKGEEQLHFLKSGSSNVFPKNKARGADVTTNDTWVGKGPEDDKYGRVGTGWPWGQS